MHTIGAVEAGAAAGAAVTQVTVNHTDRKHPRRDNRTVDHRVPARSWGALPVCKRSTDPSFSDVSVTMSSSVRSLAGTHPPLSRTSSPRTQAADRKAPRNALCSWYCQWNRTVAMVIPPGTDERCATPRVRSNTPTTRKRTPRLRVRSASGLMCRGLHPSNTNRNDAIFDKLIPKNVTPCCDDAPRPPTRREIGAMLHALWCYWYLIMGAKIASTLTMLCDKYDPTTSAGGAGHGVRTTKKQTTGPQPAPCTSSLQQSLATTVEIRLKLGSSQTRTQSQGGTEADRAQWRRSPQSPNCAQACRTCSTFGVQANAMTNVNTHAME